MDPRRLLSPDILTHEFVDWVQQSHLLRRAFREVAVIAGLVERQHPGKRKTGKQVTFSTDLIYDVLRKYEPDHVLIEAAWADARARMTDVGRLGDVLDRAAEQLVHVRLDRVSPLAVPVMTMIGREALPLGAIDDELLLEAEEPGRRGDAGRGSGKGTRLAGGRAYEKGADRSAPLRIVIERISRSAAGALRIPILARCRRSRTS